VAKSRAVRLAGNVVRVEAMRNLYTLLLEETTFKDIGVDRRIILKCTLKKQAVDWV
jgi:hypothetical protein